MRLAIVGSRTFQNPNWLKYSQDYIVKCFKLFGPEVVISGGAEGIDTVAEELAKAYGITTRIYTPKQNNWTYYKARNILIAADCTHLLCIRCRYSKSYGSGWTADYAESIGKEVHRITL